MLRLTLLVCALFASALCSARPMIIHPSQTLKPPAGYAYFGYRLGIDGDWAIITAATPASLSSSGPPQTEDALLYHRVNGQWKLDRKLASVSATYPDYYYFAGIAMNNGLAAIGPNPTRIFKRTNNAWAEIAHPFTAPKSDPDFVTGDLIWDGSTLLAARDLCTPSGTWGARIATLKSDGTWTPLERLSRGDALCQLSPERWAISGSTVIAGTRPNDVEFASDNLSIFRRSGNTWIAASSIAGGMGQGDVRSNEIFFASGGPGGTLVYRNDDSATVLDQIRTASTSYRENGATYNLLHTSDLFVQDADGGDAWAWSRDVFRKNAAGEYEHVATIVPPVDHVHDRSTAAGTKISGRRLISQETHAELTGSTYAVSIYDLPATYAPSSVIATGFESVTPPIESQLGAFGVATASNGNHVYRQSSLAGDFRAVLANSDWAEQSIEADIKPTTFSGTDRWVGLAVRYVDPGNYYYVTLRSSGVVALKRMRDGAFVTLQQRSLPIVAGRNYHVGLQALGSIIFVYVDGQEFIRSEDNTIAHGSAALLGYRSAADYDNIVAAQVGQRPIYDSSTWGYGPCSGSLSLSKFWAINGSASWNCSTNAGVRVIAQSSVAGDARALVGTPTDDQVVMTRTRATAFGAGQDRWFGIAARYVDESNYYYLSVRNSNTVSLRKLVSGTITVLGTATLTVKPNTWYDLRLDAVGNELRAFVNGSQVLQATDSSHASGQGGLVTYKTAAEYTDYRAWQP